MTPKLQDVRQLRGEVSVVLDNQDSVGHLRKILA